jgi:multidrug resistance efflux pump
MKFKLFSFMVVILTLSACAGSPKKSPALPSVAPRSSAPTSIPGLSTGGVVTASGVAVSDQEVMMAFKLAGNVKLVQVKAGDQVQAGQVLVQLDDSSQKIALEQTILAMQVLTSPEAIANAKLAITTAQKDVINTQTALNNQEYWKNTALIQNYYASYVLSKDNLDKAQDAYDSASVGEYINNANEAEAYQRLYNAKQAYDNAKYYYSLYSQAPTQRQMDEAQANLELANAQLADSKNYLAVLTGGNIPDNAGGSALASFKQAKLAIQTAQNNLDATLLIAPFSGEVASITTSVGNYVSPGQVILVISDITHMHIETTDLSERDIPYVKLGQAATVSIKALGQDVVGKVSVISPLADKLGGDVVYKVTITLEKFPANLLSGMSVDVRFDTSQ